MDIYKKVCGEAFSTHKATIIENTDRYLIIDWRRADGSSNYYVNYIVDKRRGSLIVSGDLGDSIATWYNPVDPAKLKNWIYNDIGYYIGKLRCSSDKYECDEEDVIAEIRERLDVYDISECIAINGESFGNEDEFWELIADEVSDSIRGGTFIPTERLEDIMRDIDADYWEWIYDCGKRIHIRVYMWAVGFYMACGQLGI